MAKGEVDKENIIFAIEHCLLSDSTICEGCYQDGPGFMGITCKRNVIRDALALLKEQQETRITVDANGIRTDRVAHWKGFTVSRFYGVDDDGEPIYRRGLFYVCSKCKRRTVIKTPYCPQCGAMMEKGVKQNG